MTRERAPKKISTKEAVERGEKELMLAASEGMSAEEKFRLRQMLLDEGTPKRTLNKLFPDLAPLT